MGVAENVTKTCALPRTGAMGSGGPNNPFGVTIALFIAKLKYEYGQLLHA